MKHFIKNKRERERERESSLPGACRVLVALVVLAGCFGASAHAVSFDVQPRAPAPAFFASVEAAVATSTSETPSSPSFFDALITDISNRGASVVGAIVRVGSASASGVIAVADVVGHAAASGIAKIGSSALTASTGASGAIARLPEASAGFFGATGHLAAGAAASLTSSASFSGSVVADGIAGVIGWFRGGFSMLGNAIASLIAGDDTVAAPNLPLPNAVPSAPPAPQKVAVVPASVPAIASSPSRVLPGMPSPPPYVVNNPVTIIREEAPASSGVSLSLFRAQIDSVLDSASHGFSAIAKVFQTNELTVSGDATVSGTLTADTLLVGNLSSDSALSAPELTVTNATTTNATSTNLYATNLTAANATSTNLFATAGRFATGIIDSLASTGATKTNLVATALSATTATITSLTGTNALFANATTTSATSTNLYATNLTAGSATITAATSTSLYAAGGHFLSGVIDSLTSTTGIITNLTASIANLTPAAIANLTATNATTTNATSTSLYATNLTAGSATSTSLYAATGRFLSGTIDSLASTLGSFTGLTATNSTTTNATSTNLYSDTASSTRLFSSLLAVGGNGLVYSAGNVGVGTSSPWRKLSVFETGSNPQFTLAYDVTRYSQLQTDAVGDLSFFTTGGNAWFPDANLSICSGGACPSLGNVSISGTGNLVVENRVIAGSYERSCPSGYVWVPGLAKYGTMPGFCVMKYEARNSGGTAVSVPAGTPWVSISQTSAKAQCQALGTEYHLISEPEWMTIAEQIATLPINDLDADAGLQLAVGHSDNVPANALDAGTGATDPVVSGCNLMVNLEDAANAYAGGSCELRGTGAGGSLDADKGFYGTGQSWSATGYSAGAANKSQLRTHILPNRAVIWDISGDVYDWTDAYLKSASAVGAASTTVSEMPDAGSWTTANWYQYTAITNFKGLNYARPADSGWSSTNGVGQIYLPTDATPTARAFLRGAVWSYGSTAGVFSLALNGAPSSAGTIIGFRCAR